MRAPAEGGGAGSGAAALPWPGPAVGKLPAVTAGQGGRDRARARGQLAPRRPVGLSWPRWEREEVGWCFSEPLVPEH